MPCQYVCELVLGVNVPDLDLGVQIDSMKQPIKSNSEGPGNMPHCGTPAFDYHFNHGFIVLKHVQHHNGLRKFDVSKAHYHLEAIQNYRAWLELWFDSSFVC